MDAQNLTNLKRSAPKNSTADGPSLAFSFSPPRSRKTDLPLASLSTHSPIVQLSGRQEADPGPLLWWELGVREGLPAVRPIFEGGSGRAGREGKGGLNVKLDAMSVIESLHITGLNGSFVLPSCIERLFERGAGKLITLRRTTLVDQTSNQPERADRVAHSPLLLRASQLDPLLRRQELLPPASEGLGKALSSFTAWNALMD